MIFFNRKPRKLVRIQEPTVVEPIQPANSEMDQGDHHAGPLGYSANTAYFETQYGMGFEAFEEENEIP